MLARRLALEDFRSYRALDLALAEGTTIFIGPNGAGKTNLLEALALIAWGSSPRATNDAELVRWEAECARVRADVERTEGGRRLEALVFAPREGRRARRFSVDGTAKRFTDLTGELRVVAFFPEEVALLSESPAARRRYLDALVGQVDRYYRRELIDLHRVLEQRNALLRRAREEGSMPSDIEVAFWDAELARLGGAVAARRAGTLAEVGPHFREAHARLSDGQVLTLVYASQVERGSAEEMARGYAELIPTRREAEFWRGSTLVGPHRDDLRVEFEGRPLTTFASRGEHRTAVLALKLAEASWIAERTAEDPLFLLDDVLSELDPVRRERLAEAVPVGAQCLITAASAAGIPPTLTRRASRLSVGGGTVDAFDR